MEIVADPLKRSSQLNLPPRITANRRQLDDRFPVLGFTIFTHGSGHYEVLIASHPALLAPGGASQRNNSNFHSSRQESGLIPIPLDTAVYVVPSNVLRSFVEAKPRPSNLYYTVVFYSDPTGSNPVFAQAPDTLASSAPSVAVSNHFGSDEIGDVFGIRPDRLRLFMSSETKPVSPSVSTAALAAEDDIGEGEDGTSAPPLRLPTRTSAAFSAQADNDPYEANPHQLCDSDEHWHSAAAAASSDVDYEDGYSGDMRDPRVSSAQQISYKAGDSEPSALQDDTVQEEDSFGSYGKYHSLAAWGEGEMEPKAPKAQSAGYGDEADENDDSANAYRIGSRTAQGGDDGKKFYAQPASADWDDGYGDSDYRPAAATAYGDEGEEDGTSMAAYPLGSQDSDMEEPYPAVGACEYGPKAGAADYRGGEESEHWVGSSPAYQSLEALPPPFLQALPLTIEAKRDLIGKLGDYCSILADAEYNGGCGQEHPAYRRYHLGLSYGIARFNQDRGGLGILLEAMFSRDSGKFQSIFGPDSSALIALTKAPGLSSAETANGRSVRIQPLGGADLWQEPWTSRFREAGCHKPFQSVQNQIAAQLFLDPMLSFGHGMGLESERALAILMDLASELGPVAAREWFANAVGPLQTPPLRHQALAALGYADIRSFQAAHPGVETNGQWGPLTHAVAVGELRKRGNSPAPIPSLDQMLDAIVRRSAHTPWFGRIRALRHDVRLGDTPFH